MKKENWGSEYLASSPQSVAGSLIHSIFQGDPPINQDTKGLHLYIYISILAYSREPVPKRFILGFDEEERSSFPGLGNRI